MAPLDQLPVFEIEEAHNRKLVIPQSSAILRYLGMLGGMYPEDPAEALIVDSICECVSDALRQIEISMRSSSRSILEFKSFTDEECAQIRVRLAEDEEHGARKVSELRSAVKGSVFAHLVYFYTFTHEKMLFSIVSYLLRAKA